jgi:hypothetical protein
MSKLHVFGSYGDFEVDGETGVPTGHESLKEYNDITKFDVAEYKAWIKKTGYSNTVDQVDIIAIGFWSKDKDGKETYCPCDLQWRKQMIEGWPQPIIANEELANLIKVPR